VNCLYISYTGLMQPLGQSQVFPYLEALADDHELHLITFERARYLQDEEALELSRAQAQEAGIEWTPLKYHSRPTLPATAWDLANGYREASRVLKREDIDVVHARGHQLAPVAALLARGIDARFLFDVRGFWVDAKADAGQLARGSLGYRFGKLVERRLLEAADGVVVLAEAARRALEEDVGVDLDDTDVAVIPTCVDTDRFRPPEDGPGDPFTLGYVGSASGRYEFEAALRCFRHLREIEPEAEFRVLNRGDRDRIRAKVDELGVDADSVRVDGVPHERVPHEMARMDAGVFFYPATFSSKATSPTKLGEFLASGAPCLTRAGVGDVDAILRDNDVGIVLDELEPDAERAAVKRLHALARDPDTRRRCRRAAEQTFALGRGGRAYGRLYERLAGRRSG
jgi:glycosyltransferase involved in cell wall biosynthesis